MKNNLAPIVLFTYNRLWHTQQTIEALRNNELAGDSELFIFSDGAKKEEDIPKVQQVREYLQTVKGFKRIEIIEREKNWGLANNIIDGVTKIVNEYGKIIVLEDDLVTSPYFLKFMNEALEFYKDAKKVWHISGWNYPIKIETEDDVFFWRVMNCWGWATWANRWQFYKKDVDYFIKKFSKQDIYKFNLDGYEDFWNQILANKKGKINTWAIFWYATIFENDGLCLNPVKSFVKNIGLDGSGTHCGVKKDNLYLNITRKIKFHNKIEENSEIVSIIKKYYLSGKKSLIYRIFNKIKKVIIKR